MTVNEIIEFDPKGNWGISGYNIPVNTWYIDKPRTFWSKKKKTTILDQMASKRRHEPGPGHY